MYTTKARNFPVWYFFECRSEWINVYIRLRASFDSLQFFSCCLSIWHFCYDPSYVHILCSKIVCLTCIRLLDCLRTFSPYFRCFGRFCFVCIVWFCFGIFLVFLLLLVPSDSSLRVVSFVLIVLLFPLCRNISYFSSVLSSLLVFVDFLSEFATNFPIPF